jgi:hypothetical protein
LKAKTNRFREGGSVWIARKLCEIDSNGPRPREKMGAALDPENVPSNSEWDIDSFKVKSNRAESSLVPALVPTVRVESAESYEPIACCIPRRSAPWRLTRGCVLVAICKVM